MTKATESRDNHYVPQWYQRGFLSRTSNKLYYLDLDPETITLPSGKAKTLNYKWQRPTSQCFYQTDLYTRVISCKTRSCSIATTAKAALLALTRTCAAELGPSGITVNMVSGGLLRATDASVATPYQASWPLAIGVKRRVAYLLNRVSVIILKPKYLSLTQDMER